MLASLERHLRLPTPVTPIVDEDHKNKDVTCYIKRDELIHPQICGNKWRKLKYNFQAVKKGNYKGILSYGGMYSNHLLAIAAAGNVTDIPTVGVIRSYAPDDDNPTIQTLRDYNMQLEYVHPTNYKNKETSPYIKEIIDRYDNYYVIPEGGTNILALKGVIEMIHEIEDFSFTHVVVGLGTGGTLAGVMKGTKGFGTKVIGISPFKGKIEKLAGLSMIDTEDISRLELLGSALTVKFGGYHKDITNYINSFKMNHNITLDPVYTVKVMMTVDVLIKEDYFPYGSKILVIHTGGIQGVAGYNYQYRNK